MWAAATKKSAERGMHTAMKGRRRPSQVQVRSLHAPTTGCTTVPSIERVLLIRPMSSGFWVKRLRISGRVALLKP